MINTGMKIRPDFAKGLQAELHQKLGKKGTETRDRMEKIYDSILTNGELDIEKLPKEAVRDIKKLQDASEQFEAFYVKKMLAQMRATTFSKDKSPMMDFAKETMDDAISSEMAKGQGSMGIAKTVFLSQGLRLVQQSVAPPSANATPSTTKPAEGPHDNLNDLGKIHDQN
ncbi:MAG: rod-binding protein [Fimbriimonadaceae bacterium]